MKKRFLIVPVMVPVLAASAWVISDFSWQPAPVVSAPKPVLVLNPLPALGPLATLPAERPSAEMPTPRRETTPAPAVTLLDEFNQVLSQPTDTSLAANRTERSDAELLDLADVDLSGLSPELVARVENALVLPDDFAQEPEINANRSVVELERQASLWQGRLPQLNLQTHIYASDPDRRWVKVNGREYRQQQWIDERVKLVEIQPQRVVVEFEGTRISMPALYEWRG